MRSYTASIARLNESRTVLAGGVASTLRAAMRPTPLYIQSALGARLWDVDGNEYIDYLLAYGPLILGHAHPAFVAQVHRALTHGVTYGLQHDGEITVARLITELVPSAEQVALSHSGSEAVMLALRLARAFTRRTKVIRFHGHYHGWSDTVFTSFPSPDLSASPGTALDGNALPGTAGQSEKSLQDLIVIPWNDPAALRTALDTYKGEVAAVITEPVMCNSGCLQPRPQYLQQIRDWTTEEGIVLVFDEVITGFRVGLSGAQGRFGVLPDLTTLGKALAGGIALSAVAGRADIMRLIAHGVVNHLGTLNGNCAATAAAAATLAELARDDGQVLREMEQYAQRLAGGLRALSLKHNHSVVINQVGAVFHMMFIDAEVVEDFATFQQRDAELYARFAACLLDEGVLVRPSGLWYVSAVHGERELTATLQAVDRAFAAL